MVKHTVIYVLAATLILCHGDHEADLVLQKYFEDFDAVLSEMRDGCIKETSVKIADLKAYDNVDDFPESELCFYKCFYEKIGLLDASGKVIVETLNAIPQIGELDAGKREKLDSCLQGVDNVVVCVDLKQLKKCFDGLRV